MWWLIGLLVACAAASHTENNAEESIAVRMSGVVKYRSKDGTALFAFQFAQSGEGNIRIYVLDFPNADESVCHMLEDDYGDYICWSERIPSVPEARTVAAKWAEATLVYQRTGVTF